MSEAGSERDRGTVPRVSVVMPACNAEQYINAAVESILSQTLPDLELVAIDDASTDSTWQHLKDYEATDGRVRVFRNEVNQGVTATTIRGIELARAPVIARMDADDVSMPTRIERQLAMFDEPSAYAVVGTYAAHINEEGSILSLSATGPSSVEDFEELRRNGEITMVFGGTAMFRLDTYLAAGGLDPSLTTGEDVELFDRMADLGPVVAIAEPLVHYRLHERSLVRNTFFEGRQVHRFVKARRHARASGVELTLESFRDAERSLPLHRRAITRIDDLARFHYRESGMAFGNQQWLKFGSHLAIAALFNPLFVAHRLWAQRLSRQARTTGS